MDLIQVSIKRPVTILSIIIMLVMFGMISLERIPYQLSPSVVEPEITVTTTWRGATPYEIEREIIEEQENTLDCRLVWAGTFWITPVSTPGESKWRYVQRQIKEMGFDATRDTQRVMGFNERNRRFWEAYAGEGLRYADRACSARRGG